MYRSKEDETTELFVRGITLMNKRYLLDSSDRENLKLSVILNRILDKERSVYDSKKEKGRNKKDR